MLSTKARKWAVAAEAEPLFIREHVQSSWKKSTGVRRSLEPTAGADVIPDQPPGMRAVAPPPPPPTFLNIPLTSRFFAIQPRHSARPPAMTISSRSQIILSEPIGDGLDTFRQFLNSNYKDISASNPSSKVGLKDLAVHLIVALQGLPVARALPSVAGRGTLRSDLLRLELSTESNDFDLERVIPFLRAVLNDEPDEVIWDKVYSAVTDFANSTEHRKYVDGVLKEELGQLYVGVPGFFKAYFGSVPGLEPVAQAVFDKCKEGDNPLYQEESGWQGWPKGARERDVLSWFARLTSQLLDFAEGHQPASQSQRRPLAQPHQPIQGSTADRKLDVGFSQILIPGELKSNPSADKVSKAWLDLGRYAREVLAAQDSRCFVLGFTLCGSLMQLWEFDRLGGIASTRFNLNDEQLGFDPTIITAGDKRYIKIERDNHTERLVINKVMKQKVHQEGDESRTPLVVKDSWQFLEREEEGELLREATNKGVVNVARYYHHETVRVDGQNDNIRANLDSSMPPPSTTGRRISRKDRSSSAAGQKRSSSRTDALLPPSKRTCSSSPIKGGKATTNRVHRRVITSLLATLEGCIDGYKSLHTRAGMLQFKEQQEKSSGARGKTGTRAFMAIGNYVDTEELAELKSGLKGLISDERDFLKNVETKFTSYYKPLVPYVNRLRRKVFPGGGGWRAPNPKLYFEMKEILRTAQDDLKLEG
ncbi:hypothetical protein BCR34DRAFT_629032 [Clohesyomyces aquaticus]|uniref:Fungal-type protein kinase domain-containing protein n=1 Tax=Clohesyomyces aquaticus TaxID=1231657 RepID=A0A1Y1YCD1_9PLEO|nr:hypothetical protein BCR34DRAFT_629032 [Clohesyomyces aquaticus]